MFLEQPEGHPEAEGIHPVPGEPEPVEASAEAEGNDKTIREEEICLLVTEQDLLEQGR